MLRTYGALYWTIRRYVLGKRYRTGWSKYLEPFLSERAGIVRERIRSGVCPFCGRRFKPARGVVAHSVRLHMYAMHKLELKSLVDQLTVEYYRWRGNASKGSGS